MSWQDTGLVIAASQTVSIQYLAGQWTANPHDNDDNLYDASGNPQFIAAQAGYTMPGQDEGALIGKIGDTVFLVGDNATAPGHLTGNLMLCINDDLDGIYGAGLKDNIGYILVQVTTS